ncbi:MAG: peptidoglycan DD-metalloendopeptidase family protein [Lachnospirales bacterium]
MLRSSPLIKSYNKSHIIQIGTFFGVSMSVIFVSNAFITLADNLIPKDAFEIVANNEVIGNVSSIDYESEEQLLTTIQNEVSKSIKKDISLENTVEINTTKASKTNLSNENEIVEAFNNNDFYDIKAYEVVVDNEPLGYIEDYTSIESYVNELEAKYKTENSIAADAIEDIQYNEKYIDEDDVKNTAEIKNILSSNKKKEVSYIVQENDTIWDIAQENNLVIDDVLALNNLTEDDLIHIDDTLTLSKAVPFISVETTDIVTYETEAESPIEFIENPNEYVTYSKLITEGKSGVREVTEKVTKVNGIESNITTLEEKILVEPSATVMEIGTAKIPPKKALGSFIYPCKSRGRLSDTYKTRGGRHAGVDIALPYGTNVIASDGGVVKHAGWMRGYGYLVIIDHENGYQTYYGHNSKLTVSVGERVAQGQTIAKVGSTGRSTGNHIHFEVRVNGKTQNPFNYVS